MPPRKKQSLLLTVRGHQEAQHLADSYIRGGNRLIFHVFRLQKPELTSGLPARTRRPFKPPRMTLPERKLIPVKRTSSVLKERAGTKEYFFIFSSILAMLVDTSGEESVSAERLTFFRSGVSLTQLDGFWYSYSQGFS